MESEKIEKIENLVQYAKDGKLEIVYREGKAPEYLPPVNPLEKERLLISGRIGTIAEFLSKRQHLFNPQECNISVDINGGIIQLLGNECQANNSFTTFVNSNIKISQELESLIVNKEMTFDSLDLARELRRRKNMFINDKQFQLIFSALSSFKAEVNREIEKSDDKSGNAKQLLQQKVTHNLPKTFQLSFAPYEGSRKIEIEVEIDVNHNDLRCSLMSFDLDEQLKALKEEMIQAELDVEIYEGMKLRDWCVVYFS